MNRFTLLTHLFALCLLLSACSPGTPDAQATALALKSASLNQTQAAVETTIALTAAAPTSTPTNIPSPTETPLPSPTPTNTASPTPTITPTPLPNLALPGVYLPENHACAEKHYLEYNTTVQFCVTQVTVDVDWNVIVQVTWATTRKASNVTITKRSDRGNRAMYLKDDLGNKYDHFDAGGGAVQWIGIDQYSTDFPGWFKFGPLAYGASMLTFYDDDQEYKVTGIQVVNPSTKFVEWKSAYYNLSLLYNPHVWQMEAQDTVQHLVNLELADCTITEMAPSETPSGRLNQTVLGNTTFDIYRFLPEEAGRSLREYRAVKSPDLPLDSQPAYKMSITAGDQSVVCVAAISDVMRSLQKPLPENYWTLIQNVPNQP